MLSTRCRLARNQAGAPFPWRATELQRRETSDQLVDALRRVGTALCGTALVRREDVDADELDALLAWRYVSLLWSQMARHRWLAVGANTACSVLVQEEDHLRLQAILPGDQIDAAVSVCTGIEDAIQREVEFARDDRFGHLTASPVNAGCGMRVSALMHLPGLSAQGSFDDVLKAALTVGCSVRGLYGEGTLASAGFVQVSNTTSYGIQCNQVVERVSASVRYLVDAERMAREEQFGASGGRSNLERAVDEWAPALLREDLVPRRLLPLVSLIRLAVSEGILEGKVGDTSRWVAAAGVTAARPLPASRAVEHFEAVRRTAALRAELRRVLAARGTSGARVSDGTV
ncbi:MAG TPA: hypothetical protein VLH79_00720 [Chthonomonadales bacterium]|nr:hypothetical protein [Chthonomonadales bacterium]